MPPAGEGGTVVFEDHADLHRRSAGHVRVRRGAIPRAQTGKKNSSPLIKELPLSSGILSF